MKVHIIGVPKAATNTIQYKFDWYDGQGMEPGGNGLGSHLFFIVNRTEPRVGWLRPKGKGFKLEIGTSFI
jgi:hypothetical protein